MRKRVIAELELSTPDMRALLELIAANSLHFEMHDVEPKPAKPNGLGRHSPRVYPKEMEVRLTGKDAKKLSPQQREIFDALRTQYGNHAFRKGEASARMSAKFGMGASSVLTLLCRRGYLAAP